MARLEARLPPSEEKVLTITVTRIGEPDEIIEMRGSSPGRPTTKTVDAAIANN